MDRWIIVMVFGQLAFAGFIIWLAARSREARMRQRSEERARMLDRFSSAQEMTEFLSSAAGARFLRLFGGQSPHPMKSLATTVTAGVISFFAGVAFLVVSNMNQDNGFRIPGMLGLMVGLGILISAAISGLLYRRAGLLSRRSQENGIGEEP
jgi:hypothetical protein